jgi:predicted small lipoprotein YifL
MKKKSRPLFVILSIGLSLFLISCGQKGPLYLPSNTQSPEPPQSVTQAAR